MDTPIANITVTMTIPPQKYMAASMEIMSQYGNVVEEALREIKEDLMSNKQFQQEVKDVIRNKIQASVECAVKKAAEQIVWETFFRNDVSIEKIVKDAILSTINPKESAK